MGDEFRRPSEGFPFNFLGMKLNSRPDTLPPGKYAFAQNIRAYSGNSVRTRPGQLLRFSTSATPVLDMRAYAALSTDNKPRILAYHSLGDVWLDNGVQVGVITSTIPNYGASMIPFRPGASPTPWMYIANGIDYQKLSAPTAGNAVTQQKVGIAEPQVSPDATIDTFFPDNVLAANMAWVNGGTAGAVAGGTRSTDTVGKVLLDPVVAISGSQLASLQVGSAVQYQKLMHIAKAGGAFFLVLDVFPSLIAAITISSIFYFSGSTGRCIVVPSNVAAGPGVSEQSVYAANFLQALRRGAIIQIGAELCLVWSVSTGPNGAISIETSTVNTHTTADTLTSVPAILVANSSYATGNTIASQDVTYQVTTGIGTQTTTMTFNPFLGTNPALQPEDYVSIGVQVDNLANLNELKILFDVGDGSFTKDFYYYAVRPSDIAQAVANATTQLGSVQTVTQRALIDEETAIASGNQLQTDSSAQLVPGSSQWTQIVFPISALTRVGNDQSKSLQNASKIQFLWNASGTINVATSEIAVFGGFQSDVGDIGAPYLYRVRPRSSVTGVRGNPSPAIRYGINSRRLPVTVRLPNAAYDTQIDTWDIFRYGGSVTSWRFIGSTPSSNSTFADDYDDSAAQAGEALDFDNFEPWPSLDLPLNVTATQVTGTIALISVNNIPSVARHLPGNLVQLGGANVYTLRARPTLVSGNPFGAGVYLLEFVENAGALASVAAQIYEPALANQMLPYMWGPDAAGTVFAVGDSLRPGTLYFAKNYAPDSAPDTYNLEITPPSEPLLGGEVIDGLSLVASTERWWALYPQPGNPQQRYSIVQQPFTRGLIAPFGHCEDGQSIYWWAKDGIYSSTKGSLTDADLYNLFPHEGVAGQSVTYNGQTVQPPDYSRTGGFRLAYANGYLYATYIDVFSGYHTLVMDTRTGAWSLDAYSPAVSVLYHPEQQAGAVVSAPALYDELLMGNTAGQVATQRDTTNDLGGTFTCVIAAAEFDGGDSRAPKQWGDFFVDLVPVAPTGVAVRPMSLGAGVAGFTTIPSSPVRQRSPVSVGGVVVSDFMGLYVAWIDNFTVQGAPTTLYLWQPSFTIQPAKTVAWYTFGSSFGMEGYGHVREVALAYVSTAAITLTITSYDGLSPAVITLPSTGGAYKKTLFVLTANKGQLYNFQAVSSDQFQLFLADSEIRVGQWGRAGPYAISRNFGDKNVAEAVI